MDSMCPAASCIASQSSNDFGEAFNTTFTQMWDTFKRTNRMLLWTLTTAFVRGGYGVRGRSSGVGSALFQKTCTRAAAGIAGWPMVTATSSE